MLPIVASTVLASPNLPTIAGFYSQLAGVLAGFSFAVPAGHWPSGRQDLNLRPLDPLWGARTLRRTLSCVIVPRRTMGHARETWRYDCST